ncbi:MAG: CBS domain-containing protein [Desulfovibrio sp.]|nr:CBS domain-containing protein [Desulfovibrio sp.]MBI4959151.1 CBS domain-containing protein [Desulfovibrio sp.]
MPVFKSDPSITDILAAMGELESFVDITPSDAEVLFRAAHEQAMKRIRTSILVRDLMTTEVLTLSPGDEVRVAAKRLAEARVSGAPVTDNGALVGVVSVKDFLRLLGLNADSPPIALASALLSGETCSGAGLESTTVGAIMTSTVRAIGPDTPAFEAAQAMSRFMINRMPVMAGERLAGIITRSDIVRAFGDLLGDAG